MSSGIVAVLLRKPDLTGRMRNLWSAPMAGKLSASPADPHHPEASPMNFLSTPAYAQDATGGMLGNLAGITQFLPILLIFIVFYFLLIRPQQQRQKALKALVSALKRGDRVVTSGGIIGVVQRVREGSDEIEVEIAPNVRVQVVRDTISTVLKPPSAANDSAPVVVKKD